MMASTRPGTGTTQRRRRDCCRAMGDASSSTIMDEDGDDDDDDESYKKRPSPATVVVPNQQPQPYDHLDKRQRWTTSSRSSSIDSILSTRTEPSKGSGSDRDDYVDDDHDDHDMQISEHDALALPQPQPQRVHSQEDLLDTLMLENLVEQMENWTVTNFKEWRRQQSMSSSEGDQKEKIRMAKSETMKMMRRGPQTTTAGSTKTEDGNES